MAECGSDLGATAATVEAGGIVLSSYCSWMLWSWQEAETMVVGTSMRPHTTCSTSYGKAIAEAL